MATVQHNTMTGADLHVAGPVTTDLDTTDQASDPASPASGHHALYSKSGGLYLKDSGGTVTPLAPGVQGGYAPLDSGLLVPQAYLPSVIGPVAVSGTPTSGQVPTATSGTAASWQTLSGGIAKGTSFPSSPATNDLFFRTDRGLLYEYDGTRWLTVTLYSARLPNLENSNVSPNQGLWTPTAGMGTTALWLVDLIVATMIVGATDAANYWTFQLQYKTSPNTDTNVSGASFTTAADTSTTYAAHRVAIGASLPSTALVLEAIVTATGSPAPLYAFPLVTYRLIA